MDLHRIPQWICKGPWSLIHFSYNASWLLLVLLKLKIFFRDLMLMKVSELNRLFGSLLDQFVLMCLHHSNLILIDSMTFRFPLLLLKVRSVRMLNMIVCSGPSVWLLLQDECLATFYLSTMLNPCLCTVWVICTDPNGTLCVLFVRKTGFLVVLCV